MKDELAGKNENLAQDVKASYNAKMGVEKSPKQKKLKGSERRKLAAEEKAKVRAVRAANRPYFIWAGLKLMKPTDGIILLDGSMNIFADPEVGDLKLDHEAVQMNYDNGDYLVVLRRFDTNEYKYAALTVTSKDILKAREQRLQLSYTGGLGTVVSLLERDLKMYKHVAQSDDDFIDKNKEDFLSIHSLEVIAKDIERIIKTLL